MKKRNWRLMLRRVLNLVFSRLVITVTLVLLQVFWLFSVFHWLDAYSTWLNGVGLALSVIMCLALIRQDSTAPEFKISWMIIFMLMPVQGGLLYLLWGNMACTEPDSTSAGSSGYPYTVDRHMVSLQSSAS